MDLPKKFRLFWLYTKDIFRSLPTKKRYVSLFLLMGIIFSPKLIYTLNWNAVFQREVNDNPVLYQVDSAEALNNATLLNILRDDFHIIQQENEDQFKMETLQFIHSLHTIWDINNSISTNNVHGYFPVNITRFISFLHNNNIIKLEGQIPNNPNEVIIDKHFQSFISNSLNRTLSVGDFIHVNISTTYFDETYQKEMINYPLKIVGCYTIHSFDDLSSIFSSIQQFIMKSSTTSGYNFYTFTNFLEPGDLTLLGNYNLGLAVNQSLNPSVSYWNLSEFSSISSKFPLVYHKVVVNPLYAQDDIVIKDYRVFRDLFSETLIQDELDVFNQKNNSDTLLLNCGSLKVGNRLFNELDEQGIFYLLLIGTLILLASVLYRTIQKKNLGMYKEKFRRFFEFGLSEGDLRAFYILSESLFFLPAYIGVISSLTVFWQIWQFSATTRNCLFSSLEITISLLVVIIAFLSIFLLNFNRYLQPDIPTDQYNKPEPKNDRYSKKSKFKKVLTLTVVILLTIICLVPIFDGDLSFRDQGAVQYGLFNDTVFFTLYPIIVLIYSVILFIPFSKGLKYALQKVFAHLYAKFVFKKTKLAKYYVMKSRKQLAHMHSIILISFCCISLALAFNNSLGLQEDYIFQRNVSNFGGDLRIDEYPVLKQEYNNVSSDYVSLSDQIRLAQFDEIDRITQIKQIITEVPNKYGMKKLVDTMVIEPESYFESFSSDDYEVSHKSNSGIQEISNNLTEGSTCMISKAYAIEDSLKIGDIISVYFETSSSEYYINKSGSMNLEIIGICSFLPGLKISQGLDLIIGEASMPSLIVAKTQRSTPVIQDLIRLNDRLTNSELDELKINLIAEYGDRILDLSINPKYDNGFIQYDYLQLMLLVVSLFGIYMLYIMKKQEMDSRSNEAIVLESWGLEKRRVNAFFNIEMNLKLFFASTTAIFFLVLISFFITRAFYFTSIYHFNYFPKIFQNAYYLEGINDFTGSYEVSTGLSYDFRFTIPVLIVTISFWLTIFIAIRISMQKIAKKKDGVDKNITT